MQLHGWVCVADKLTCRKANHCSSSSTGNILTLMKLIPSMIDIMVAEPWAGFRISRKNRRLTEWNRAWLNTPITSAYKSAIFLMLVTLGLDCVLWNG